MTAFKALVSVCVVVVGLLAVTASAVTIATVPVGNAGNAGDTRYPSGGVSSFGSVAYTYNIGKYEVTAGQYTAFLNAVAATDTYGLYSTTMSRTDYGSGISRNGSSGSYAYSVDAAFVNRPVNCVSWGDSVRFANWLHNNQPTGAQGLSTTEDGAYYVNGATISVQFMAVTRKTGWRWAITSEDEWYKAACYNPGSSSYYDYPTSSNTAPGRDLNDVSGNNANSYTGSAPGPIDSPYYTTVAGEFQNSDSPYGTFDQGGNVWEWNEAILNGPYRGLRGGSFGISDAKLRASSRSYGHPPSEDRTVGFRVSEVPEPAAIMILALGSALMLRRKRT